MTLQGLLLLLLFLSPFLLPLYLYLRNRNSRKAWNNIKQNFGFKEVSKYSLKGTWKGETFTIRYKRARRRERASITINLECSLDNMPEGKLRAERWWDKLGKASGLVKEFQSRSDEFNDSVYVDSNDHEFLKLLQDTTFCDAVAQLIESRLSQVEINPPRPSLNSDEKHNGKIAWHTTAYLGFWKKLISPSYLEQILSSLIRVKERLENKEDISGPVVRDREESGSPSSLVSWIGYGLPVGSLLLGGIFFFWSSYYPTLTTELQVVAFKIAGIALLVYCPIAYFCFRGESDSHIVFLGFVILTLFGLPLFTVGTLTTINGFLDSSDAVWQKAEIVAHHSEEGEYSVTVKGVHNGKKGEPDLEVSEEIYNRLLNQDTVIINIKDVSEPWIKELEPSS